MDNAHWKATDDDPVTEGYNNKVLKDDVSNPTLIPHYIIGDLDAAPRKILQKYAQKGTKIISSNCVESTDLQKAIVYIGINSDPSIIINKSQLDSKCTKPLQDITENILDEKNIQEEQHIPNKPWEVPDVILCLGAFGGRFDQEMSGIHILYRFSNILTPRQILMGLQNIAELVGPDINILLPSSDYQSKPYYCGLLAFGMPVHCISAGFRWNIGSTEAQAELLKTIKEQLCSNKTTDSIISNNNLKNVGDIMEFTGLLSTNNISEPITLFDKCLKSIVIYSDGPLLYTSSIYNSNLNV